MPFVSPNSHGVRRNTFARLPGDNTDGGHKPGERHEQTNDAGDDLRRALAENTRDQDDVQRGATGTYPRELLAVYTEPLYLSLPNEPQVGISLVRIRHEPNDEIPVLCGSMVHFWWDGAQSRAVITSIDGLTPDGSQYRFNFLVVG